MTPKQELSHHLVALHGLSSNPRWTLKQLAGMHARRHHRHSPNHHHGLNPGPNQRPAGWYTGANAVRIR